MKKMDDNECFEKIQKYNEDDKFEKQILIKKILKVLKI